MDKYVTLAWKGWLQSPDAKKHCGSFFRDYLEDRRGLSSLSTMQMVDELWPESKTTRSLCLLRGKLLAILGALAENELSDCVSYGRLCKRWGDTKMRRTIYWHAPKRKDKDHDHDLG